MKFCSLKCSKQNMTTTPTPHPGEQKPQDGTGWGHRSLSFGGKLEKALGEVACDLFPHNPSFLLGKEAMNHSWAHGLPE